MTKTNKTSKNETENTIFEKAARIIRENEDWLNLVFGGLSLVVVVVLIVWLGWHKFGHKVNFKNKTSVKVENQVTTSSEGQESQEKIYVVKRGDYLWKIAELEYNDGYQWVKIAQANHLKNPNILFKGQKLIIPQLKVKQILEKEVNYQVRKGDTLWHICQSHYHNPYLYLKVAKYNHLKNPNILEVGEVIKLPPLRDIQSLRIRS